PAEVVETLLAAGLLPDERVGVEPDQGPLVVEIDAAAAGAGVGAGEVEVLRRDGGVLQGAPVAAGLVAGPLGNPPPLVAPYLRRPQPAARRQHQPQVLRQPLVDPQQPRAAPLLALL